jgi:hypothetical protein
MKRRNLFGLAAGISSTSLFFPKTSDSAESDNPNKFTFHRDIGLYRQYDLVICGGGPSGCAAALSARRAGLSVLIIESQGQVGGMGTSGMVSHWLGGRTSDCEHWVVGGIFREMSEECEKQHIALIPKPDMKKKYQPHGWLQGQLSAGIPFDPYGMAYYLDKKITSAGIDLLFFTHAVDVAVKDNMITHVIIFNKNGLTAVPVLAVIDATGDADIAERSGCETMKGRESDHLMTPATLQFQVYNVNQDELSDYIHKNDSPRFRSLIQELREKGEWPFTYDIFICSQLTEKGTMFINTSRLTGIDGTSGESITQGMSRGRDETQKLLNIMRKYFPGFSNVQLKCMAPLLGIRETRRIKGNFMLKVDDLVKGYMFDDTIGFTAYGWDLPDPERPSFQPMRGTKTKKPVTPIPYRIMLPRPVKNLICPGRAVCVERDVLGPLRVMAPCMAMGQAAGQASVQVVKNNVAFPDADIQSLRKELTLQGAIVDWD